VLLVKEPEADPRSIRTCFHENSVSCFPLFSCWGTDNSTFTIESYSYFNFAESRREAEEHTRTSYIEYEVDASALKADEGRGDRRNVPGELHASAEPGVSEWGNPSRVMSGHRLLNT
jgi:hypothetical protein